MTERAPQSFLARHWPVLCGVLGAVVLIALVTGRVLYRPFNAQSASMEPTIEVGDLFLVEQFAYREGPPTLGDVIIFRGAHNTDYVKRITGLPGDRVQMIDGVLYINKRPVPKVRTADFVETDAFGIATRVPQYRETLPAGRSYLVLDRGDGEMDHTQEFTVPANAYFVMGDNRDNSDDSRLSFGFIRLNDVIGQAAVIYFANGHPVWREVR